MVQSAAGWLIGHFIGPDTSPLHTTDVEIKWGIHQVRVRSATSGQLPGRGNANRAGLQGQSFHRAYCHFDAQTGEVNTLRSNDLQHLYLGRVVSRQQHDQPPLVELHPPDFATLHKSS